MVTRIARRVAVVAVAILMLGAGAGRVVQAGTDKWLHVRVDGTENGKPEIVRINFPLSLAIKLLPMVKDEDIKDGRIRISGIDEGDAGGKGLDATQLRAMWNAVKETEDSEFVTVESEEETVRVAKAGKYFLIHATGSAGHADDSSKVDDGESAAGSEPRGRSRLVHHESVEVKIPLDVVDALLSGGEDELNLTAAIEALSKHDDSDLVLVNDENQTVRIWIDSRNSID